MRPMEYAVWRSVLDVVGHVLNGSKRATKYISPALTLKATRRHKPRRGERAVEVLLTIGKPNYAERQFIADCKKAGVPFPVRKVQLKAWSGRPQ